MKNSRKIIFVYGTLKKGFRADGLLSSSLFLGCAETPPMFEMYGGSFPMIYKRDPGHSVLGEAYSVDQVTMERLDQYEGFPSFYSRMRVPLRVIGKGDGIVSGDEAWVYYIEGEVTNNPAHKIEPTDGVLVWRYT